MRKPEMIVLWNLMAAAFVLVQTWPNAKLSSQPSSNLKVDCLANLMRISLDEALAVGNQLEVDAINGTKQVMVTPSLAARCGYSMESDPWGNTRIYTSLLGCYVDSKDDVTFNVGLKLKIFRSPADVISHDVSQTCSYTRWAPKEILCDRNYMEVSTYLTTKQAEAKGQETDDSKINTIPGASGEEHGIWKMTFYTPEAVSMVLKEVEQAGYSAMTTPTRLVVRSPYHTSETYHEDVAGVPMEVLKVSVYQKEQNGINIVNLVAACPTGGVLFTDEHIAWHVPRRVTPLLEGKSKMVEMYMGINGQRLDKAQMAARKYTLSTTDFHIVVEIPIGSPDGYYKSRVQDNLYYVSYMIEPMLELLWTEDLEDTRYKVFLNIVTHFLPRPPQLMDNTIPEERMFKMTLGHFASDVALINISFPNEVLSMADCSARGFNVFEYMSPNSTMKVFTLQVPFTYPAVHQRAEDGVAVYSLHLTFGLLVLNELVPFSHAASLQAFVQELVPPSVSGGCDNHNFYVLVKFGTKNYSFQTLVGKSFLTPTLAQQYGYMENGTHFSFVVPFSAPDVVVEAIESSSVKARIGVVLRNPETNALIQDFSVACHFPTALTECFPNGTMTALAVKLESVPSLNPSQLTLADSRCHPSSSDDRHAYFVFTVNSCGTTRKFLPNAMLYENEISLPNALLMKKDSDSEEPDYHLKVTCLYEINTSQAVSFNTRPRRSEPYAENSKGHLEVVMKLSLDDSYREFQPLEVYPIAKYLQQPLYFEVELTGTTNPQVSLELENCWATQDDRTTQPRWNLIIDGCPNPVDPYQVIFHPVWADARIKYPSHFKRFEVQMFAFADGKDDLHNRLFIHCDVVICDVKKPLGGVCSGQCSIPEGVTKGEADLPFLNTCCFQQNLNSSPQVRGAMFQTCTELNM
uniref:Uncharacterized LOC107377668 n=1 Tax=Nothobranchius furzeri TaxID=105023 RepID=A0A8C6MIR3_NOTFU